MNMDKIKNTGFFLAVICEIVSEKGCTTVYFVKFFL
jgi:hypothetical protein